VERGPSNESQRPFPSKHEETEDEVDDLEDRQRLHSQVEVFGEEVPEDLRPEEAFDCCCYLICVSVSKVNPSLQRDTYKQQQ